MVLVVASPVRAAEEGPREKGPAYGEDPYELVRLGERFLDRGDKVQGLEHLTRAFRYRPDDEALAGRILGLVGAGDEAARLLWTWRWWRAAADENGRARPSPELRELPLSAELGKLEAARAKAVIELLALADSKMADAAEAPENALLAWWARRAAHDLARSQPALFAARADGLRPDLTLPPDIHMPVIKALEQILKSALPSSRSGIALRAARSLFGMGVQAGFKDLKGERPRGMERVRKIGASGMARAREQLRRDVGKPWTVDDLEWFTRVESEAFTRGHDSFAFPGVAVSPNELYRIETDCGAETLLGVARTVEYHHARLVGWFGRDPFEGRQGIVRIVPEANGLEAEGAPFWWAGGFQGGDTTVLRFSCGRINGLGHGLTHELTHRFDGAIYPGMPLWLVEGRAVWTGSAFGPYTDEVFVEDHASFGTLHTARIKGYGGYGKLATLIEGKLEDYRDNYTAGYALYLYLNTWREGGKDGERIFQDRLLTFMKGCRKGRRPRVWFEKCFCDGKEGRPENLKDFAEGFDAYLAGFHWKTPKPWREWYTQKVPKTPPEPFVYDEPTWTWTRGRCEPIFGQEQAWVAAKVLLDLDRGREAVPALLWALRSDGRRPDVEEALKETLFALNRKDAAWALTQALRYPYAPPDRPARFLGVLRDVKQLLKRFDEVREAAAGAGPKAASFLATVTADRNRLALWLGVPLAGDASEATGVHPEGSFPLAGRAGPRPIWWGTRSTAAPGSGTPP